MWLFGRLLEVKMPDSGREAASIEVWLLVGRYYWPREGSHQRIPTSPVWQRDKAALGHWLTLGLISTKAISSLLRLSREKSEEQIPFSLH